MILFNNKIKLNIYWYVSSIFEKFESKTKCLENKTSVATSVYQCEKRNNDGIVHLFVTSSTNIQNKYWKIKIFNYLFVYLFIYLFIQWQLKAGIHYMTEQKIWTDVHQ